MRWIVGIILATLATAFVVSQVVAHLQARRAGRNYSVIPFIGAGLGMLSLLVFPVETGHLWAAVLLLDFTVPLTVISLAYGLFRRTV